MSNGAYKRGASNRGQVVQRSKSIICHPVLLLDDSSTPATLEFRSFLTKASSETTLYVPSSLTYRIRL